MSPKTILISGACGLLATVIIVAVGVTPQAKEEGAHPISSAVISKTEPAAMPHLPDAGNGESRVIVPHPRIKGPGLQATPHGKTKAEVAPLISRMNPDASVAKERDRSVQDENVPSLPTKVRNRGSDTGSQRLPSITGSPRDPAAPSLPASAPAHIGTPGVPSREAVDPQPEPRMPAVLASSDPGNPLPEEVEKAIDQMAEDFAKKMEESGLTPDDPDYAKLWQQAAEISDREFRARYGKQAWMRLQIEAHRMQETPASE